VRLFFTERPRDGRKVAHDHLVRDRGGEHRRILGEAGSQQQAFGAGEHDDLLYPAGP
jgi:hypothetical protein